MWRWARCLSEFRILRNVLIVKMWLALKKAVCVKIFFVIIYFLDFFGDLFAFGFAAFLGLAAFFLGLALGFAALLGFAAFLALGLLCFRFLCLFGLLSLWFIGLPCLLLLWFFGFLAAFLLGFLGAFFRESPRR